MKKHNIFILLLLCSMTLSAQNNQIKIGGGLGVTPYEGTAGWNAELQYVYQMSSNLSGFASLGMIWDEYTSSGRSQGGTGTEAWDNSWEFQYPEQFNYIDFGVKYKIYGKGQSYDMKATLGGTLGQSIFNYPDDIFIDKGIIVRQNEVEHKVELAMFLLGFENYFYLNEHLFLNLNVLFRTTFKEKHILERKIAFHNNLVTTSSGILNVMNLNLQMGFVF